MNNDENTLLVEAGSNTIHFLLVPDAGAARRLRRRLAEETARSSVVVGTYRELLSLAADNYLVCIGQDHSWHQQFHKALASLPEAFWGQSYQAAPTESAAEVERAYALLVSSLEPGWRLGELTLTGLDDRVRHHIADLVRLQEYMDGALPPDLALEQQLVAAMSEGGVRSLRLYHVNGFPRLTTSGQALVTKLNEHSQAEALPTLIEHLKAIAQAQKPDNCDASALAHVQRRLFSGVAEKRDLDSSVQWLGVRDALEEAEVAAGMVQQLIAQRDATPQQIGVLLPDNFEYEVAVEDAFAFAGLPLSGLPRERWRRDLGYEAVYYFLACRQKPAPAMAMASCLTGPLMPWDRETGAQLAQQVVNGNWELEPSKAASKRASAMLELLSAGDNSPEDFAGALGTFVDLLDAGDQYADDIERAEQAVASLQALLEESGAVDWQRLRRAVLPQKLSTGEAPQFFIEGVTIFREGAEAWRDVNHLLVLGFSHGHYPRAATTSSVFTGAELEALASHASLDIETPGSQLSASRARFLRQLCSTRESLSVLIPFRDGAGQLLVPSDSLVFMFELFGVDDEAILNLDIAAERAAAEHVATAEDREISPPYVRPYEDLELGTNLLHLRKDDEGKPKPESPSALESMMVSPLAWLLQRLHAEPQLWSPDEATVLLLGSLSHKVFENIFAEDKPLPSASGIAELVDQHLTQAIATIAPFMATAGWRVERRQLRSELIDAAQHWLTVIERLGASILKTEVWLQGSLKRLAIHGQADILLELPGNRLLVVDYKKSGSSTRRKRMEKGYESQVSLYRVMLDTGGLKGDEDPELAKLLAASEQVGIVYFTMNDFTCLTDASLSDASSVPGWSPVEGDVASEAMALLEARVGQLSRGKLMLNRSDDADFFRKGGVTPYALEATPLTSIFMLLPDSER
jgi:ATP-dependent helicase/nuclease subunit B